VAIGSITGHNHVAVCKENGVGRVLVLRRSQEDRDVHNGETIVLVVEDRHRTWLAGVTHSPKS
jgi:hypothetical protein